MNNNNEKMYVRSNGDKIPMKQVHSEHLINSLAKKYKEIFSSNTIEEYDQKINELNDIKEEIYSRIGKFYTDKWEDK